MSGPDQLYRIRLEQNIFFLDPDVAALLALTKNGGWKTLVEPGFREQFLGVRKICGEMGESPASYLVPDYMRELLGWPVGEYGFG